MSADTKSGIGGTPGPSAPPAWSGTGELADWEAVRRLWSLDPARRHCNHGSFGALPRSVRANQDALRTLMESNPVGWFRRELPGRLERARTEIARFVGGTVDSVALVTNASAGASAVLSSLRLNPGDELLVTDHIYGAVGFAARRVAERSGARVVTAEIPYAATADEVLDGFARRCSDRTRLVIADEITSATARRFPVAALTEMAHACGAAILIDGAHAPGMLELDLDAGVSDTGASGGARRALPDYYVGNLHKWACAPRGTAVLWASPACRAQLLTPVVSWSEPLGFPASFDQVGTADLTPWLAAPASIALFDRIGWERVRRYNTDLAAYGQHVVAEQLGIAPASLVLDEGLHMAVVPLPRGVAGTQPEALALQERITTELGIEIALTAWGGRGLLRISAQAYNHPSDYEHLAHGLAILLAG
jgi:isopenicillin-N epimerase